MLRYERFGRFHCVTENGCVVGTWNTEAPARAYIRSQERIAAARRVIEGVR